MLKKNSIVLAPMLEAFARVVDDKNPEAPPKSSMVKSDGSMISYRQRDEDLAMLFENCSPGAPIGDIVIHNIPQVIVKIARFFWRKIVALEGKDKARQKEIERLKEELAQFVGHHKVY